MEQIAPAAAAEPVANKPATSALPTEASKETPKTPAIPDKFKGDVGKLVDAYNNLEKRLSQGKTDAATTEKQGSSFAEIEQRFYANRGELSIEDRLALNQFGFSDRWIDGFTKSYQAEVGALKNELATRSNGADPDKIIEWINSRIGTQYSAKFVESVNEALAAGKFGLWNDLVADYAAANPGTQQVDGKPYTQGNAARGDGFNNLQEIRSAFANIRSGKETQDSIRRRLDSTNPELVQRFANGEW